MAKNCLDELLKSTGTVKTVGAQRDSLNACVQRDGLELWGTTVGMS